MLNEIITSNFDYNFLVIMSLLSILFGIFVIISKNPIVSVLFLIGLFIAIACYLMTLGINFIGLSYLLVYVGAVSILFLFILMLINVRVSELTINNTNSIPLAILVGIFFNISMSKLFVYKSSMEISINNAFNTEIYPMSHNINYIVKNAYYLHKNELYFVTSYL
jgi:NADH-ubiquinone oxidoreductase chain 6